MKLDEEFRYAYLTKFKGRQHDRRDVCLFAETLLRTKLVEFANALTRKETRADIRDSDNRMFMRGYNQCAREVNREIATKLLNWGLEVASGSKSVEMKTNEVATHSPLG